MIKLKCSEGQLPTYETKSSAGADLRSTEDLIIPANSKGKVPTGIWIDSVNWDSVPENMMPELQIRARSGLAYKHGITLTNAVGTIDADYPGEICVLIWNTSDKDFEIKKGDRIAQVVQNLVYRIESLPIGGERVGGFGSTKVSHTESQLT